MVCFRAPYLRYRILLRVYRKVGSAMTVKNESEVDGSCSVMTVLSVNRSVSWGPMCYEVCRDSSGLRALADCEMVSMWRVAGVRRHEEPRREYVLWLSSPAFCILSNWMFLWVCPRSLSCWLWAISALFFREFLFDPLFGFM